MTTTAHRLQAEELKEIPENMRTDLKNGEQPEGMGFFSIADYTGDSRFLWDPKDPAMVDFAKEQFRIARTRGLVAHVPSVNDPQRKGEVLTSFNPEVGAVIFTKPLAGG